MKASVSGNPILSDNIVFPAGARRLVIKIGSAQITSGGKINSSKIRKIVSECISLIKQKKQIILVSSGAIASARFLFPAGYKLSLIEKQALASIGQVFLMEYYKKAFGSAKIPAGQILLAESVLHDRGAWLNARSTILKLLELGAVPIINENDSISHDEIKYGDNDTLGAVTAGLIDADLYIMLSNVDGLYKNYPHAPELLPIVRNIDRRIEEMAGSTADPQAVGGMITKIRAARMAVKYGIPAVIANGTKQDILKKIIAGQSGTVFLPSGKLLSAKQRWISAAVNLKGKIIIDSGAAAALCSRKSLLPRGITGIQGKFHAGDVCAIINSAGQTIARGISAYSASELEKILGQKTSEIEKILGYKTQDAAVHADNCVIF